MLQRKDKFIFTDADGNKLKTCTITHRKYVMLSCLSLLTDHKQPCMLSFYKDSKTRQEILRKKENRKKKEITLAQNIKDTLRFICTFSYNIVLFNHLYYLYTQFSCFLPSVNSPVL